MLSTYPFQIALPARYTDIDGTGCIGHIGLARYYEEVRSSFMLRLLLGPGQKSWRGLMGRISARQLAPATYPQPLSFGVGVANIGSRSFAVEVAAFQGELCIGYSRAITVVVGKDHSPAALNDDARAILTRALLPSTHLPAATKPGEDRQQLSRYEHRIEFVTRFSDTDAIGHLNNIAVLRYCEEGRAALLVNAAQSADPRALGAVVSFDISYLREAQPFVPLIVATSLESVDGSQVRLIQALFQENACVATCDWALEIPPEIARKLG